MSDLSGWALGFGIFYCLSALLGLSSYDGVVKWVKAFPRSVWPGRALVAVDMIWVAWLLIDMHFGSFEYLEKWIYPACPVAIILICVFVDELLAPRALGGLLLLLPAPILVAARWHPSAWRYVMIVLAYAVSIKGILLVLAPYRFRKWMEWFVKRPSSAKHACYAVLVLGLFLVGLAFTVY